MTAGRAQERDVPVVEVEQCVVPVEGAQPLSNLRRHLGEEPVGSHCSFLVRVVLAELSTRTVTRSRFVGIYFKRGATAASFVRKRLRSLDLLGRANSKAMPMRAPVSKPSSTEERDLLMPCPQPGVLAILYAGQRRGVRPCAFPVLTSGRRKPNQ